MQQLRGLLFQRYNLRGAAKGSLGFRPWTTRVQRVTTRARVTLTSNNPRSAGETISRSGFDPLRLLPSPPPSLFVALPLQTRGCCAWSVRDFLSSTLLFIRVGESFCSSASAVVNITRFEKGRREKKKRKETTRVRDHDGGTGNWY